MKKETDARNFLPDFSGFFGFFSTGSLIVCDFMASVRSSYLQSVQESCGKYSELAVKVFHL